MRITFPHIGNAYIAVKAMLDELGADYVIPPYNNKRALELGTKYAPEMACLPLKITIGNFIQAYEMGADTILMLGGCGPCRFGYYCEMHREILKDAGYEMGMITLDVPNRENIRKFFKSIDRYSGVFSILRLFSISNIYNIIRIIKNVIDISTQVDELERLSYRVKPREIKKGETESIMKKFHQRVKAVKGAAEIKKLIKNTADELESIEVDSSFKPLRVGIVGEIYTTIDSYTSFNIQNILGDMGVEVNRSITISDWIVEHMIKKVLMIPRDLGYAKAAKPYLKTMIGGHAQETIGNTILYAKKGYDGVIQIYPLTCMPEIVAESILPNVERDYNIPVMTLIIDEMTGEAGYLTRVEAFIDLLARRKERSEFEGKWVLSGN